MIIFIVFTVVLFINCSAQKYVDLGHEVSHDIPVYPLPNYLKNKFELTVVYNNTTPKGFWLAYNKFCTLEHLSTHIDAPYHLYEKGWTLDEIPLQHLIAPAVVIDVTAKAAENPNYLITAEDVDKWVSENGVFPNNSIILGRTGWSKKFKDPVAYLGHVTDHTKLTSPGFGVDSIRRILSFKKTDDLHVVGFGIDTISLDHGPSEVYEAHQVVQGENIYILENMNNLEALPIRGAKLFVMPMKITGGTGAPARIIAELPITEEGTTLPPSTHSPSSHSLPLEVISEDPRTNISTDEELAVPSVSSTTTTTTITSTSTSTSSSTDAIVSENVPETPTA